MTQIRFGEGPSPAQIMIVGECYGEQEERYGQPFQGPSGQALNSMLHDAGIMRSECYTTNLVNARPPYNEMERWIPKKKSDVTSAHVPLRDKFVLPHVKAGYESLLREIEEVKPNVIIALGNYAMWALTGQTAILKWRGSQLYTNVGPHTKVIPTIHPTAILREFSLRQIAVNDLKRAAKERETKEYTNVPDWNFIIRPAFSTVIDVFSDLAKRAESAPIWVDFDLETSPLHITCFGLSWSRLDAICVPITDSRGPEGYWSVDEEAAIIHGLYKLLTNPNVWVRGQNLLYDCQHTYRWWHFVPNVKQDTMIAHHSMFCGMKKSLDFQASLYADYYFYWKSMAKDLSNKAGA